MEHTEYEFGEIKQTLYDQNGAINRRWVEERKYKKEERCGGLKQES